MWVFWLGNLKERTIFGRSSQMSWTGLISFRVRTNIGPNCGQGTIEVPYRFFSLFAVPVDIFRYKTSTFIITVHLCIICIIHCLFMNTKTINTQPDSRTVI